MCRLALFFKTAKGCSLTDRFPKLRSTFIHIFRILKAILTKLIYRFGEVLTALSPSVAPAIILQVWKLLIVVSYNVNFSCCCLDILCSNHSVVSPGFKMIYSFDPPLCPEKKKIETNVEENVTSVRLIQQVKGERYWFQWAWQNRNKHEPEMSISRCISGTSIHAQVAQRKRRRTQNRLSFAVRLSDTPASVHSSPLNKTS